jgi:predicted metal-dependent hydrolase
MSTDFSLNQVQVMYSKRRSIVLQVKNGQIFLKAPLRTPIKFLEDLVAKKQHWIKDKIELSIKVLEYRENKKSISQETAAIYKKEFGAYLEEKVNFYAEQIGVTFNKISIRKTVSRWGSCTSKGNLSFSIFLWNKPNHVIDYVIVHELCHRKYMNHSKAFWNLVEVSYPEYQLAEKWLKINGNKVD